MTFRPEDYVLLGAGFLLGLAASAIVAVVGHLLGHKGRADREARDTARFKALSGQLTAIAERAVTTAEGKREVYEAVSRAVSDQQADTGKPTAMGAAILALAPVLGGWAARVIENAPKTRQDADPADQTSPAEPCGDVDADSCAIQGEGQGPWSRPQDRERRRRGP